MNENEKCGYEAPTIVIIEFDLKDAIAMSTNYGPDLFCGEEIYE